MTQERELTSNIPGETESLLATFTVERRCGIEERKISSQKAATDWNHFVDQHGSFADELSTL